MKRLILLFCFCSTFLFAQPKEVGRAASDAAQSAKNPYLQNWIVAGIIVAATTAGLIILGLHEGKNSHDHSH